MARLGRAPRRKLPLARRSGSRARPQRLAAELKAIPPRVGRGLFAGLAGTAAMTLASALEAKLRRRKPSSAPADAAGRLLGVRPCDEVSAARFSRAVHWGYGTSWGAVRGLLGGAPLGASQASAAHFGLVWLTELVMLPGLGVTEPPWRWGAKELALDAMHHGVYAGTAGLAYARLAR